MGRTDHTIHNHKATRPAGQDGARQISSNDLTYWNRIKHDDYTPTQICAQQRAAPDRRNPQIVQVDAAKLSLRFYLDRSDNKKTSQVHSLAVLIKTIAKHWICVDEAHLKALGDLCKKVAPDTKGMTPKNRGRLRQFVSFERGCSFVRPMRAASWPKD